MKHVHVETVQEQAIQYGALDADGDVKIISGATGKDADHRSSGGGYKIKRRKRGATIVNNPECLYRPLGAECGNNAKGK